MPRHIPGLTAEESRTYREAMASPAAQTFRRATVLDLDHKPLRSLSMEGQLLGGQLRWNTKADVHTEATVIVSDFDDEVNLNLRHLVRLEMGVGVDDDEVLWCPLITGWVRACSDTGHEAEVLLHDKAAFGLHSTQRGSARRGEYVGEVLWRMHYRIGERHFAIPDNLREGGPKLASAVEWGGGKPEKSVTRMARRLAKRAELQVFYDQLGRLVVRHEPGEPTVSWVENDDGDRDAALLEPIRWRREYAGVRNAVIGRGRRDLTSRAVTADGYTFSTAKMVRGGEGVRLEHRFTDDTISTKAELEAATEAMLRRMSVERSEVQIASTPTPWLVAHDRLHARKRDGRETDFWLREGGMELDGSGMTIGYQLPMRRRPTVRSRTTGTPAKQWRAEQRAKERRKNRGGKA